MTNTRATQTAVLGLIGGPSATRSTQAAVMVLAPDTAPARSTQAPVSVLVAGTTEARATHLPLMVLATYVPCATQWAQCWLITKTDGSDPLGFTSLDEDLTFNGVVCKACKSLSGGALEFSTPLGNVGNQEVNGLLDDERISEEDLYSGLYDGAAVEVWKVPWLDGTVASGGLPILDPLERPRRMAKGTIGSVSQGDVTFTAEVLTAGAKMEQVSLVELYSPGCRYRQYDTRCGLSYDANKVTGTVTGGAATSAPNKQSRRVFFDTARTEDTGAFNASLLTWTSGDNEGQTSEVKTWDKDLKRFVLWDPLRYPISAGDTYEVAPSCGNIVDGCKSFSNYINYGGQPDVPGRDELIESPNSKG